MITPNTKFKMTLVGLITLATVFAGGVIQVYQAKLDIKKLKDDVYYLRQWQYSVSFPNEDYAKRWRAEHRWFRDDRDE